MKYIAALAILAVPLALAAAPSTAEAAPRGGLTCHWVKKTKYYHGRKYVRFVKKCHKRKFHKKRHARRDYRHNRRDFRHAHRRFDRRY